MIVNNKELKDADVKVEDLEFESFQDASGLIGGEFLCGKTRCRYSVTLRKAGFAKILMHKRRRGNKARERDDR